MAAPVASRLFAVAPLQDRRQVLPPQRPKAQTQVSLQVMAVAPRMPTPLPHSRSGLAAVSPAMPASCQMLGQGCLHSAQTRSPGQAGATHEVKSMRCESELQSMVQH